MILEWGVYLADSYLYDLIIYSHKRKNGQDVYFLQFLDLFWIIVGFMENTKK